MGRASFLSSQAKGSPGTAAPRLPVTCACLPCPCSVPEHPVTQLLKRLQCAVYRALYPIVSRGVAAASAPGCCSLPPDADGLLAPGSRRLRPSQSLYCMLCPPEPSPGPQPLDGPPADLPTSPLPLGPPERGADSSPKGPPSPLAGKDSSFEDLEQFLATSERRGQSPGGPPEPATPGLKEPLLEQLRSTVKDIHNAIGEAGADGPTLGGEQRTWQPGIPGPRCPPSTLWLNTLLSSQAAWALGAAGRLRPRPPSIPGCLLTGLQEAQLCPLQSCVEGEVRASGGRWAWPSHLVRLTVLPNQTLSDMCSLVGTMGSPLAFPF